MQEMKLISLYEWIHYKLVSCFTVFPPLYNMSVLLLAGEGWCLAMTDFSLIEDLTHLVGPLTEETVVRCLQAKFYSQRFQVISCA